MFKRTITILIITSIIALTSGCQVQNDKKTEDQPAWKDVKTGLSYKEIHINISSNTDKSDFKDFLLVKINPRKFTFKIYENKKQEAAKTIDEIHAEQNSLLTFNGQFFTEDFKPTGLLISEGEKLKQHSSANLLNGIIAINNNKNVYFFDQPRDLNEKQFTFAIQNGPVLINKKGEIAIQKDTEKNASRTAIGVDNAGNLILIILKQTLLNLDNSISLYKLAHLLKNDPQLQEFKFQFALNLDGGSSTGLMIDNKYYPEMEKVQNVVLVFER